MCIFTETAKVSIKLVCFHYFVFEKINRIITVSILKDDKTYFLINEEKEKEVKLHVEKHVI